MCSTILGRKEGTRMDKIQALKAKENYLHIFTELSHIIFPRYNECSKGQNSGEPNFWTWMDKHF
jgi:hypothetical protein